MRSFFRGLRWRLTLRYTIVTVATLLVVEILIIAGIGYLLVNSNLLPSVLIYAIETFITPEVATYLDSPQPDIDAMTDWLESAFADGLTFQSAQNPRIILELGDLEQDTSVIVLDLNLERLSSIPEIVDNHTYELSADVLRAAQSGETDPELVSQVSDGLMTTAVPVVSDEGKVMGIVLMVMPYPPRSGFAQALSLVGSSLIFFTVLVGIIGTIFGYFTARGLTRRLSKVSQAAGSWSQGDFSAFIQDHSTDEIGQLSQQLNRMAEQLQTLLQAKEELAMLEERNRLSRDLHDSVKQQVFATVMQVGAARALLEEDPGSAKEHLDQAEGLAQQAQAELNTIIRELRPATLQDLGLTMSLKELAKEWSEVNDIGIELDLKINQMLPHEIEQALFRLVQEALSNIARHSQATHVEVQLTHEDDDMLISISDDGQGFDVLEAKGKGVGLGSMRERVETLGGSFKVESTMGQGTRLSARIPNPKGVQS